MTRPWNLNIHYDEFLANLVPGRARVLDVGCGDGFLSARLASSGCEVVGIDADAGVLSRARERWAVLSNAALHHLPDTGEGLRRFAALVRPGGAVGVVGFASNGWTDWPMSLAGGVCSFVLTRARGMWEHTAPIHWPPPLTYGETRRVATSVLPGSRFRRTWLGRYALAWTKPAHR